MSKKYKIGIPGWKTGDNSFGALVPYINFIVQWGEPIILFPESSIREDLDLLILPGGPDVDTARYGEKPGYYTSKPCPHREYFDVNQLPIYIDMGTSIYGICRGFQSIAVHFGAKLHQHIKNHPTNSDYERDKLSHEVNILHPYHDVISRNLKGTKRSFRTNSMHHQSVDGNTIQSPLRIIGRAQDSTVEILVHESLPIVGLQWHPEEIDDIFSNKVVEYLLQNKKSLIV